MTQQITQAKMKFQETVKFRYVELTVSGDHSSGLGSYIDPPYDEMEIDRIVTAKGDDIIDLFDERMIEELEEIVRDGRKGYVPEFDD